MGERAYIKTEDDPLAGKTVLQPYVSEEVLRALSEEELLNQANAARVALGMAPLSDTADAVQADPQRKEVIILALERNLAKFHETQQGESGDAEFAYVYDPRNGRGEWLSREQALRAGFTERAASADDADALRARAGELLEQANLLRSSLVGNQSKQKARLDVAIVRLQGLLEERPSDIAALEERVRDLEEEVRRQEQPGENPTSDVQNKNPAIRVNERDVAASEEKAAVERQEAELRDLSKRFERFEVGTVSGDQNYSRDYDRAEHLLFELEKRLEGSSEQVRQSEIRHLERLIVKLERMQASAKAGPGAPEPAPTPAQEADPHTAERARARVYEEVAMEILARLPEGNDWEKAKKRFFTDDWERITREVGSESTTPDLKRLIVEYDHLRAYEWNLKEPSSGAAHTEAAEPTPAPTPEADPHASERAEAQQLEEEAQQLIATLPTGYDAADLSKQGAEKSWEALVRKSGSQAKTPDLTVLRDALEELRRLVAHTPPKAPESPHAGFKIEKGGKAEITRLENYVALRLAELPVTTDEERAHHDVLIAEWKHLKEQYGSHAAKPEYEHLKDFVLAHLKLGGVTTEAELDAVLGVVSDKSALGTETEAERITALAQEREENHLRTREAYGAEIREARERYQGYRKELLDAEEAYLNAVTAHREGTKYFKGLRNRLLRNTEGQEQIAKLERDMRAAQVEFETKLNEMKAERAERLGLTHRLLEMSYQRRLGGENDPAAHPERRKAQREAKFAALHEALVLRSTSTMLELAQGIGGKEELDIAVASRVGVRREDLSEGTRDASGVLTPEAQVRATARKEHWAELEKAVGERKDPSRLVRTYKAGMRYYRSIPKEKQLAIRMLGGGAVGLVVGGGAGAAAYMAARAGAGFFGGALMAGAVSKKLFGATERHIARSKKGILESDTMTLADKQHEYMAMRRRERNMKRGAMALTGAAAFAAGASAGQAVNEVAMSGLSLESIGRGVVHGVPRTVEAWNNNAHRAWDYATGETPVAPAGAAGAAPVEAPRSGATQAPETPPDSAHVEVPPAGAPRAQAEITGQGASVQEFERIRKEGYVITEEHGARVYTHPDGMRYHVFGNGNMYAETLNESPSAGDGHAGISNSPKVTLDNLPPELREHLVRLVRVQVSEAIEAYGGGIGAEEQKLVLEELAKDGLTADDASREAVMEALARVKNGIGDRPRTFEPGPSRGAAPVAPDEVRPLGTRTAAAPEALHTRAAASSVQEAYGVADTTGSRSQRILNNLESMRHTFAGTGFKEGVATTASLDYILKQVELPKSSIFPRASFRGAWGAVADFPASRIFDSRPGAELLLPNRQWVAMNPTTEAMTRNFFEQVDHRVTGGRLLHNADYLRGRSLGDVMHDFERIQKGQVRVEDVLRQRMGRGAAVAAEADTRVRDTMPHEQPAAARVPEVQESRSGFVPGERTAAASATLLRKLDALAGPDVSHVRVADLLAREPQTLSEQVARQYVVGFQNNGITADPNLSFKEYLTRAVDEYLERGYSPQELEIAMDWLEEEYGKASAPRSRAKYAVYDASEPVPFRRAGIEAPGTVSPEAMRASEALTGRLRALGSVELGRDSVSDVYAGDNRVSELLGSKPRSAGDYVAQRFVQQMKAQGFVADERLPFEQYAREVIDQYLKKGGTENNIAMLTGMFEDEELVQRALARSASESYHEADEAREDVAYTRERGSRRSGGQTSRTGVRGTYHGEAGPLEADGRFKVEFRSRNPQAPELRIRSGGRYYTQAVERVEASARGSTQYKGWLEYPGSALELMNRDASFAKHVYDELREAGWEGRTGNRSSWKVYQLPDAETLAHTSPRELLVSAEVQELEGMRKQARYLEHHDRDLYGRSRINMGRDGKLRGSGSLFEEREGSRNRGRIDSHERQARRETDARSRREFSRKMDKIRRDTDKLRSDRKTMRDIQRMKQDQRRH